MLAALGRKIFGSVNDRLIKKMSKTVTQIGTFEADLEKLDDAALQAKTDEFRTRIKDGETLDALLPEAFAVVREASRRILGLRHFDVQMLGGMTLHNGKICEMRTGEGKTLVATLAVYLNALEGKGVHVVTVNDYLASRDAEWMGKLYGFLGLTTGVIVGGLSDVERRQAYACDITYGTNNEFGFDYLRDNMKFRLEEMVQREFNFAIVDEVDSILVDEARTPLIISGPAEDGSEMYVAVNKIIPQLTPDHYEFDEKARSVTLNEEGTEYAEKLLQDAGIITEGGLYDMVNMGVVHHLNAALKAYVVFTRDKDYIVKNGKVVIIDEFTGRMMEGRRFSEGLHQALEAKENVEIQRENQTLASITFQNYFRMYPKLAGMTGTAMTEAAEFHEIYTLDVVDIPTNRTIARVDHDDEIYRTAQEKYEAVLNEIEEAHKRHQPILVGTVSIEKSEDLSKMLKKRGIKHNVLNARYHEQEAYIIAQAGCPGAVTIATNMAGRGTDIKLGGNLEMQLEAAVQEKGLTDEAAIKKLEAELEAKIAEDETLVKEAGGLYVVATERHETRRIDNQLRGRSGRQGDPGATKFFLSLEDDLMRIFGQGAVNLDLMMKKFGLPEGEPIIHPWVNKALEKAQQKVEQHNFEIRKNLLKYDNVMNDQRREVYTERRSMMSQEDLREAAEEMRQDVVDALVARCIPEGSYAEQWNLDTLEEETLRIFGERYPVKEWAKEDGIADTEIADRLQRNTAEMMAKKVADYGPEVMRQVEKSVLLQVFDQVWKEHLLALDHLRQGINLRAYGQRDPLNEFKAEAFEMFEGMLAELSERVTRILAHVQIQTKAPEALQPREAPSAGLTMSHEKAPATAQQAAQPEATAKPQRDPNNPETWGRVQRNEPCPCGSGKKYKHCHGKAS